MLKQEDIKNIPKEYRDTIRNLDSEFNDIIVKRVMFSDLEKNAVVSRLCKVIQKELDRLVDTDVEKTEICYEDLIESLDMLIGNLKDYTIEKNPNELEDFKFETDCN